MSARLALQRCWNHSTREAVARCPECSHFFCRECIVEHDGRVICSGCLARLTTAVEKPKRRLNLAPLLRLTAALAGIVLAWLIFFTAGRALLLLPDDFHADTLWKRGFGDDFREGAGR